ncbi:hypothetical protein NHX12_006762, partial [Muraenolepis orangiensis]
MTNTQPLLGLDTPSFDPSPPPSGQKNPQSGLVLGPVLRPRRDTGLQVIVPGEDKVLLEDPSRNGQTTMEEKSLVDVVYALRDEVQELKQDNKKMKRSLEEEQRARKDLEKV